MSRQVKGPYLLTPSPTGIEIVINGAIFHKEMDGLQLLILARRILDAANERLMKDLRDREAP